MKIAQIWLSALVTGGILSALFASDELQLASNVTSAVLSTVLLILNAYAKDIDPGQLSQKHKETAAALWDVRESYLSLLADLRQGGLDANVIRTRRVELQASLAQIYRTAPRTTASAYKSAQLGLQENEELTFTDTELDQLLPPALRITSSSPPG